MAGLVLTALLVPGVAGLPASAQSMDGVAAQAGLDALRQFHSYAPARQARPETDRRASRERRRAELMRKARAALHAGDYVRARRLFAQAYRAGEHIAAWFLGYLHATGRGGKVDHVKAFRYYQALARRFDPDERNIRHRNMTVDALVRLADYYRTGVGKAVRRDLRRAFRLYNLAAAYNHAGAYYGMAMVALASKEPIASKRWMVDWLAWAAMSGHAPAAWQLSVLMATGLKGVLKANPVWAEAWRIVAQRLEGPLVRQRIAVPASRNMVRLSLTEEQRRQADRLAARLLARYARLRTTARPAGMMAPTREVNVSTAPRAATMAPPPRRAP